MASDPELRWQCRRGMRELDMLLLGWLERHFEGACDQRKAAFRAILSLPDPELLGYVLGGHLPSDPLAADVIREIRDTAQA